MAKQAETKVVDGVTYTKLNKAQVIACLLMIIFVYVNSLPTPGLAAIGAAFPDVDTMTLQNVVTLPSICGVIGSFLVGPLAKIVSQKKLFVVVMLLSLISGILPVLIPNFTVMLVSRAAIGITSGASLTLGLAFVPALFAPGIDRDKMFGWGTSVGAVGGIAFQTLGGYLANYGWQMPFWGTLVIIPFIIYIWILLPDPGKSPKAEKVPVEAGQKKTSGFTGYTWALMVVGFVAPIFFYSFMTNMSLVVVGTGLGDPGLAGLIMSTFLLGTFINGLVVKWVKGALKSFYFGALFIIWAIAFTILIMVPSVPAYFVGAFLFGVGFGMFNVEIGYRVAESCPRSSNTMAMSVYTGVNGVGSYLSPVVLVPLAIALGLEGPLAYWEITAPCMLALGIIIIAVQIVANGKKGGQAPVEAAPMEPPVQG